MTQKHPIVLFDLDGTLLDTAPDLAYALNTVLENHGRPALPYASIRPVASHGTKGLLQLGFNIDETDQNFINLRDEILAVYAQHLSDQTKVFAGIDEVLTYIDKNNLQWGIVTNKPGWLTEPLLKQLNLFEKTVCVVSGDTTTNRKPHPEPLLHACTLLQCKPQQCIYVGDAQRDIEAGINAGMKTLIAAYGYIAETDHPHTWGADAIIQSPLEIIEWLD